MPKTKRSVRTINVPATVLGSLDLSGEWVFTNSGRGSGTVRWSTATRCAWLIQAGIPLPAIQQHIGYESITTTVGTYGHLPQPR